MNRRQAKVVTSLRAASSVGTLGLDPKAFVHALKGESDRGAIILAATMIDDRLRHVLEQHTPPEGDPGRKKHINRTARTFASRVELAFDLGLISNANHGMIEVIREMRNACAHGRDRLTFRSAVIVEAMDSLIAESSTPVARLSPQNLRHVFVILCSSIAALLSGGMSATSLKVIEPIVKDLIGSVPTWVQGRNSDAS